MKEKLLSLKNKPVVLLAMAVVLLLLSTVGATQASKSYNMDEKDAYKTGVKTNEILVNLQENDMLVDEGKLLTALQNSGDFVVGKTYPEALNVVNNGSMAAYVRVTITKNWTDKDGNVYRLLSPKYIELKMLEKEGWVIDTTLSTEERTVLYYTAPIEKDAKTPNFTESIRLDNAFEITLEQVGTESEFAYTHPFDGYTFNVGVEVDAVQTNHAEEAIKSAWGIDVEISEEGKLLFL